MATAWALRARSEREAEARFLGLARALGRAGAPEEVQALALRASVDEARHVTLCARLARTYGARSKPAPAADRRRHGGHDARGRRAHRDRLALLHRRNALGRGVRRRPRVRRAEGDPRRRAIHRPRRGAACRVRLGPPRGAGGARPRSDSWACAFRVLSPRASPTTCGSRRPISPTKRRASARLGPPSEAKRRAILRDTFDSLIWPKLEALGIDTGPARDWLAEHGDADPPPR